MENDQDLVVIRWDNARIPEAKGWNYSKPLTMENAKKIMDSAGWETKATNYAKPVICGSNTKYFQEALRQHGMQEPEPATFKM